MDTTRPWWRWLPGATAVATVAATLAVADTPLLDLGRYALYVTFSVVLPGTLVYRSLRRTPFTFIEDLAMGAAVGLVLELAAWAVFSALDLRAVIWLWPLLVLVPFAGIPRLRRHWRVPEYPARPSLGWCWALAGVVVFFTGYLYFVFFAGNPILPDREDTRQFLDLSFQLALAGEAKHHMPLQSPQVAGEPMPYHWFAFVHMAMTSMVGHLDLPVVVMRLAVTGLCALTVVATAVVGWRLSRRPWVGVAAAVLFFVVGDFDFLLAPFPAFGTQVSYVVWSSQSMTYSWALGVALIGVAGDLLRPRSSDETVPRLGSGAFALAAILAVGCGAAKASALPVTLAGLLLAGVAALVGARRVPWPLVGVTAAVILGQLFTTAVIFRFNTAGVYLVPLQNFREVLQAPPGAGSWRRNLALVTLPVAFVLRLQLRGAGLLALIWRTRGRLEPVQWFLVGGALAGPAAYLVIAGYPATYFIRSALPFLVIASAWGYVEAFLAAQLDRRATALLAAGTAAATIVLIMINWWYAPATVPSGPLYRQLPPTLIYATVLAAIGGAGALAWRLARRPLPGLRQRGWLVVLTAVLVVGAPGLFMNIRMSWHVPGGPYEYKYPISASRVQAARWVRAHSEPEDVLATNSHCLFKGSPTYQCEKYANQLWLSAYTERSVLLEGWQFTPHAQAHPSDYFWDQRLWRVNQDAMYAPDAEIIRELRERQVRYIVVDRDMTAESPRLAQFANLVHHSGPVVVYELRR